MIYNKVIYPIRNSHDYVDHYQSTMFIATRTTWQVKQTGKISKLIFILQNLNMKWKCNEPWNYSY